MLRGALSIDISSETMPPTIVTGDGSCSADRTDRVGVRTVRELEPVLRIRLELCCLKLDSEVDVVSCEAFARINRLPSQFRVVEDFEGHADRYALIRCTIDWNSACP